MKRDKALPKAIVIAIGLALIIIFTFRFNQPRVKICDLTLSPRKIRSVTVAGPSFNNTFVWTKDEAMRLKYKTDYPNRLYELYTHKGFLVMKWNRWKFEGTPVTDANHVDTFTYVNLSEVLFVNVNDNGNDTYHLRIGMPKD